MIPLEVPEGDGSEPLDLRFHLFQFVNAISPGLPTLIIVLCNRLDGELTPIDDYFDDGHRDYLVWSLWHQAVQVCLHASLYRVMLEVVQLPAQNLLHLLEGHTANHVFQAVPLRQDVRNPIDVLHVVGELEQ